MFDIIEAKIVQEIDKKFSPIEEKIKDIEDVIEKDVVSAIKTIKANHGKDGKDGNDGKDGVGKPGRDGRDGKSIKGDKGDKGEDGFNGISIKGDNGVGFETANVNEGGDLIIERTDGVIINAGRVKGDKGETLIQHTYSGGGGSDRPYIDQKIAAVRSFKTIAVAGQSNVVADSPTDTLTLIAGSNVTLTTDATNDSITITSSGSGGSSAFQDLTSGTNTTATMVVGTGASLGVSGSGTIVATSATGNAGTATALQNARTIGGVSFNGTANITVATATGGFTVSGGALAVGANDITSTGSLGSTGSRLTKGWFTDLTVTNAITGSITGNAATVTTINGQIDDGTNITITGTGTTADPYVINSTGGSSAFASLTAGTNTTAAMVVGTGASLATSGSGTIAATTVTGAAQTAITSVGTLTVLQVDNLNINGNTISSTSGDINIAPIAGSKILFDGTVSLDAGVIAGATSITSTAFIGNLTGNASGTAATVTTAAQPNITSVGTLTTLQVDNINIDGNTIGSTSGDITLESAGNIIIPNTTISCTTTDLNLDASSTFVMHATSGTAVLSPAGTISVGLTPIGNVGGGEDDLMSYTLPANSLSYATSGIRVTAWGTGANNINAKTVTLYIGGTSINTGTLVVSQANTWEADILFFSTGSSTQRYFSKLARVSATAVDVALRTQGTLSKTQSSDIIIKFTGTATADNDIVQQGMIVEFFN